MTIDFNKFPSPARDDSGRVWPEEREIVRQMLSGRRLVEYRLLSAVGWRWNTHPDYAEQEVAPVIRLLGRQILRPVTCAGGYTTLEFTQNAETHNTTNPRQTAAGTKEKISAILLGAVNGEIPEYRLDNKGNSYYIRWGRVEKDIHAAIDALYNTTNS